MGQVYIFSFFSNYKNLDLIFPLDRDQGSWNYFSTGKTNTISVVIMETGTLHSGRLQGVKTQKEFAYSRVDHFNYARMRVWYCEILCIQEQLEIYIFIPIKNNSIYLFKKYFKATSIFFIVYSTNHTFTGKFYLYCSDCSVF